MLVPSQVLEVGGEMQELQLLVQSLTKKVEEAEERYSLLLEQTESLKELLASEKEQYSQKENMYKQNVGLQNRPGKMKGQQVVVNERRCLLFRSRRSKTSSFRKTIS